MSEVIDIDALMPPSVTIKFGGEEVSVSPPSLAALMRIAELGQLLQNASDYTDAELEAGEAKLAVALVKCIPQLEGKELSTPQKLKLVQIISDMSTPPDAQELAKRGITGDTDPKDRSGSSTK